MHVRLSFTKVRKTILIVLAFIAVFSGGYYLGIKGLQVEISKSLKVNISRVTPPDKNVDFSLFWQVWDTLSSKYFDSNKLIPSQMVYGAISGMVSSLGDPYTMYLPPSQNKIVNEDLSGSFEGVGIEIGYRNSHLAVVSPIPGSPAEKSGIKAGDYITRIKDSKKNIDIDTTSISLAEAVADIRGSAGTKVSLTLIRDGVNDPIVIELTRAKLDIPSVTLNWVGDNKDIAQIKIAKFGADTVTEWNKLTADIKPSTKGIIVDLRNNPGGYLQAAVDIASDFVPLGTVVVKQEAGNGIDEDFKSNILPKLETYKVVVLINGGSASASEILAGALRDDKGYKLVGEKSFGKGTVQEPLEITGGSGLHVTTSKWLTPKGIWVHGVGLKPDTEILNKDESTEDLQLKAAIEMFK